MHDGLKFGSTCTVGTSTSEEKQCQAIQRRRMQLNLYETNSNCGDDTFLALLKTNGSTRSVAITIIYSTVCWGCFDSFFCSYCCLLSCREAFDFAPHGYYFEHKRARLANQLFGCLHGMTPIWLYWHTSISYLFACCFCVRWRTFWFGDKRSPHRR